MDQTFGEYLKPVWNKLPLWKRLKYRAEFILNEHSAQRRWRILRRRHRRKLHRVARKIKYTAPWYNKISTRKKKNADMKGIEYALTGSMIRKIFEFDDFKCHYCGLSDQASDNLYNQRLELDRVDSNQGYVDGNVVLACILCNRIKSNILNATETKRVGAILKRAVLREKHKRGAGKLQVNVRLQFTSGRR